MDQNNTVKLEIINFDGPRAILRLRDDQETTLFWPLNKLPSTVKQGDEIIFKILTNNDITSEHQIIARKLLEEMIN